MSLIIYHVGTGTYFNADDNVFLINTDDLEDYQLDELADGNDNILGDIVDTTKATPFWEAFDPFSENLENPSYRER